MVRQDAFEYRFASGVPHGPNSATVKIWTVAGKSDVYIAIRELAGTVKVSLHESGECISGLTAEMARSDATLVPQLGGSRVQHSWRRKTHLGSQSMAAAHICFPGSELRAWRRRPAKGEVDWLPAPALDRSLIVHCVFSGSLRDDENWPGKRTGLGLLRTKVLSNGEKLWILLEDLPTTPIEKHILAEVARRQASQSMVRFTPSPALNSAGKRITAFGLDPKFDGYFIVDAAADPT